MIAQRVGVSATPIRRLAVVTMHTSPLEQPGSGDAGGLNVYVREVSRRLAQAGVVVDVFTRMTSPVQPTTVAVEPGFTVHRIPAGPSARLDKVALAEHVDEFAARLDAHATAGSHDVLHAHYWLSGAVAAQVSARRGIGFVQTFHTLGVLKNTMLAPGDLPEPEARLRVEREVAQAADRVTGLTCGEAGLLHRTYGLSGARLAVVPAGVDLALFHPTPETGDGELVEARVPEGNGPLLLFVGRLQRLKGPDVAIQTLAEVRRRGIPARLLIVGGRSGTGPGGTDDRSLHALAAELGVDADVRIIPPQPQPVLAALYRAAEVVLVPSRSETFGLVALEAQASATPVVGALAPGLEFVVRRGGSLVLGHEPQAHADAVLRYLEDERHAWRAGREGVRMAQGASWDRTVERLLRVYGEVSGERITAAV